MNLKGYYKNIRETEETITEEFPIVVSLDTPEGGRAGVTTEVTRAMAAKGVVERWARLASDDEAQSFREASRQARRAIQEEDARRKLQVTVIADSDLRDLREAVRSK